MSATEILVADAVVATLNAAGTFAFTAQRTHLPDFTPEDLVEVRVSVCPRTKKAELLTRDSVGKDCAIDVGVQKKVDATNLADVDACLELVERIADYLRGRELVGYPAKWVEEAQEPLLAAEHLDQLGVFTGVLTVTYRVTQSL